MSTKKLYSFEGDWGIESGVSAGKGFQWLFRNCAKVCLLLGKLILDLKGQQSKDLTQIPKNPTK